MTAPAKAAAEPDRIRAHALVMSNLAIRGNRQIGITPWAKRRLRQLIGDLVPVAPEALQATSDMLLALVAEVEAHRAAAPYWVAERWEGNEPLGRWTTEVPGRTGPADLIEQLDNLRQAGWRVYEVFPEQPA